MPRAHPHVATTTALALICAAGLACRGWEPRADDTRAPEAPTPPDEAPWSLRSPLRVAAPATGWFDHAAEPREGCVLAADGTWRRGTSGHRGVDLEVATGTPVVAMHEGRVGLAGAAPGFRCPLDGRWVEDQRTVELVTTGEGGRLVTTYTHLSRVDVTVGQSVQTGEVLGRSGATGCAEGPHLHVALRWARGGPAARARPTDPLGWWGPGDDPWASHPAGAPSPRWLTGEGTETFPGPGAVPSQARSVYDGAHDDRRRGGPTDGCP